MARFAIFAPLDKKTMIISKKDANNLLLSLWQANEFVAGKPRRVVPFPTPSSLMKTDLPKLKHNDYLVTYKNDGVRCVLLFGYFKSEKNENDWIKSSVFIQRNGYVTEANCTSLDDQLYCGTAFDGELVDNNFIIFDVVAVKGYTHIALPLLDRLEAGKKILPSIRSRRITITQKEFVESSNSRNIFDKFQTNVIPKNVDGIILAPKYEGVGVGRLVSYFKYKPTDQISIDLRWIKNDKLLRCGSPGFEIIEDCIKDLSWEEKDFGDDGIYECIVAFAQRDNLKTMNLRPKIKRTDKNSANSKYVVLRTVQNLTENIKPMEVYNSLGN